MTAAFMAGTDCCERLRWLSVTGLVRPGCLGLTAYRMPLVMTSLGLLAVTLYLLLYARGARPDGLGGRAAGIGVLSAACGLLLFVLP